MKIPNYRKHSTRDLGFIEFKGKRTYFPGRHNSQESKAAYREFLAKNCNVKLDMPKPEPSGLTIVALAAAFLAALYEQENGNKRGIFGMYKWALKPFVAQHGHELAASFGPLALKRWRDKLAEAEKSRSYIGNCITSIKQTFRWGASEEIVPASVWHALQTVPGLKPGKSKAKEARKKKPVPWSFVELVLPELSPCLQAMVLIQWFTGVRSQSVCMARPSQFTREGDLLLWRPRHKTEVLGVELVLPLGPRCQAVLAPFLVDHSDRFLFSPRMSNNNRRYNQRYTTTNYNGCLQNAIAKLNRKLAKVNCPPIEPFSPHRLRHSKGTMVRAIYGLEATAATLGHAELSTSEIYSAKRFDLACQVARETG